MQRSELIHEMINEYLKLTVTRCSLTCTTPLSLVDKKEMVQNRLIGTPKISNATLIPIETSCLFKIFVLLITIYLL